MKPLISGARKSPVWHSAACFLVLAVTFGCSGQELSGAETASLTLGEGEGFHRTSDEQNQGPQRETSADALASESVPPENVAGAYLVDPFLEFCTGTSDATNGHSFCSVDVRARLLTRSEYLESSRRDGDLILFAGTSFEAEQEGKARFLAVGVARAVREASGSLRDTSHASSVYTLPGDGGRIVVFARFGHGAIDTFGGEEYFDLQFVAAVQPVTVDAEQLSSEHPQSAADLEMLQPWLSAGYRVAHPDAAAASDEGDDIQSETESAAREASPKTSNRKEKAVERGRVRSLQSFAHYGYEASDFLPSVAASPAEKEEVESESDVGALGDNHSAKSAQKKDKKHGKGQEKSESGSDNDSDDHDD